MVGIWKNQWEQNNLQPQISETSCWAKKSEPQMRPCFILKHLGSRIASLKRRVKSGNEKSWSTLLQQFATNTTSTMFGWFPRIYQPAILGTPGYTYLAFNFCRGRHSQWDFGRAQPPNKKNPERIIRSFQSLSHHRFITQKSWVFHFPNLPTMIHHGGFRCTCGRFVKRFFPWHQLGSTGFHCPGRRWQTLASSEPEVSY